MKRRTCAKVSLCILTTSGLMKLSFMQGELRRSSVLLSTVPIIVTYYTVIMILIMPPVIRNTKQDVAAANKAKARGYEQEKRREASKSEAFKLYKQELAKSSKAAKVAAREAKEVLGDKNYINPKVH